MGERFNGIEEVGGSIPPGSTTHSISPVREASDWLNAMISPHTPPGTKIVCINDKRAIAPIKKNAVYTVAEIVPVEKSPSKFHVILVEIDIDITWQTMTDAKGFSLHRFRYLDLPRSITDLLNVQPVKDDADLEETIV